jgi:pimeloyl-ACP methyl ester carboxylesterase
MPDTRRLGMGDGVELALQRFGSGATHLVFVPGFVSHVEMQWADAAYARFLANLGRFATVTIYDRRGAGASDPVDRAPTLEEHVADLGRVVDDTGAERVVILGFSNGGAVAMAYAAAHPERLRSLILCSTFARVEGFTDIVAKADETAYALIDRWGEGLGIDLIAPSLAGSKLARRNYATFERAAMHRDMVRLMAEETRRWDVTSILPLIDLPTLVLHRRGDYVPFEAGQEVARRIRGARFVELEGSDHVPYLGESHQILTEVEAFVRDVTGDAAAPRPVTTVLFTDLVGSTDRAVAVGDARWRALREMHDDVTRAEVARHHGRAVKSTGDGFLATFAEAPDAVRAASAVIEQVRRLGLELRAGAHSGPIDVLDDGDVAGTAVNTAARVAGLASAGEILVTDAVRGRLAASVPLRPWGVAELKGLPGSYTLHAVEGEVDELPAPQPDEAIAPEVPLSTRVAVSIASKVLGPVQARRAGARDA